MGAAGIFRGFLDVNVTLAMSWTGPEATAQVRHTDSPARPCSVNASMSTELWKRVKRLEPRQWTDVYVSSFPEEMSLFVGLKWQIMIKRVNRQISVKVNWISTMFAFSFYSQTSMNVQTRLSVLTGCVSTSLEATIVIAHQTLNSTPLGWAV